MIFPIERNFTNHSPKPEAQAKMEAIRAAAKALAASIDELCPAGRECSLAFTNLEQSVMWSMAAIARDGY
jgi:hypothetical protein